VQNFNNIKHYNLQRITIKLEEMDSHFKVLPIQSKATISNSRKSAKPKQHYKNLNKQQIKVNSAANHMLPSPNQSLSSALNHP
jgi:hypothetical protein